MPARNGRVRMVSKTSSSSSSRSGSASVPVRASRGSSLSGSKVSAPANSAPSPARMRKVFVGDTPSATATASRCAPSGRSPSKNGRQRRVLKLSGRLGKEHEMGGADTSSIHPLS